VYRDNQIVKKDVFVEFDFQKTIRSDMPGDKVQRQSMISPASKRKTIMEQEYRETIAKNQNT
jgi:hypothetical protein